MRPLTGSRALLITFLISSTQPVSPVVGQIPPGAPQPRIDSGANPPGRPAAATIPEKPAFGMSSPIACSRVDGLEQFTELTDVTLTNADKLKVYFRPLNFQVETDPTKKLPYRVRFVEDGQIRRKGEKTVIAKEDKLLEYETRFETPGYQIYLVNTIGLESLKPGEYELDIILHDMIEGQAVAKQSLAFRIVPSDAPAPVVPAAEPTKPGAVKKAPTKSARSTKRPG